MQHLFQIIDELDHAEATQARHLGEVLGIHGRCLPSKDIVEARELGCGMRSYPIRLREELGQLEGGLLVSIMLLETETLSML